MPAPISVFTKVLVTNSDIAGARYRSQTFPSLTSLGHRIVFGSSVRENPISDVVSQTRGYFLLKPDESEGSLSLCVFITAVPVINLFAWGEARDDEPRPCGLSPGLKK